MGAGGPGPLNNFKGRGQHTLWPPNESFAFPFTVKLLLYVCVYVLLMGVGTVKRCFSVFFQPAKRLVLQIFFTSPLSYTPPHTHNILNLIAPMLCTLAEDLKQTKSGWSERATDQGSHCLKKVFVKQAFTYLFC